MPLSFLRKLENDVLVAVWTIKESTSELEAGLQHPEYYRSKVAGLKPESRRLREILAVRCLLKCVTGEEWEIFYDPEGMPYRPDGRMRLSISHTEGFAAVICAPVRSEGETYVPGVDIERVGRRVAKVSDRFLMPEEISLLRTSEPLLQAVFPLLVSAVADPLSLHLAWSAKETAYKVLGTSFYDLQHKTTLEAINVPERRVTMRAGGIPGALEIHYDFECGYVLTYAVFHGMRNGCFNGW